MEAYSKRVIDNTHAGVHMVPDAMFLIRGQIKGLPKNALPFHASRLNRLCGRIVVIRFSPIFSRLTITGDMLLTQLMITATH